MGLGWVGATQINYARVGGRGAAEERRRSSQGSPSSPARWLAGWQQVEFPTQGSGCCRQVTSPALGLGAGLCLKIRMIILVPRMIEAEQLSKT